MRTLFFILTVAPFFVGLLWLMARNTAMNGDHVVPNGRPHQGSIENKRLYGAPARSQGHSAAQ